MADYLDNTGNIPRGDRGHGKDRKGPTFSKLESLAKRAAFESENYAKGQDEKWLANLEATAQDQGAHVAEAVSAMASLVHSTPVAALRKIVPELREIETLYLKETIFTTPAEKKHIADTASALVSFIERKTTLFERVKSTLKNVAKEHSDGVLDRMEKSSSVLMRLGARSIKSASEGPKVDPIEQERMKVRAQVAQRIVAQNETELASPEVIPPTKTAKSKTPAEIQPEILDTDKQILGELKKENENWEQDKEATRRAESEAKKPENKPSSPERVREVATTVKDGGLFDKLVSGVGTVFTGAISIFEKLFEFKALQGILGGLKNVIPGGGPRLPESTPKSVPKVPTPSGIPAPPSIWTKMRSVPGLPTTGALGAEVGMGVSAAAVASAAVVGGLAGEYVLAPATKDNSNATKRAINRYGFDVFQYGGAWWGEKLGILPPGSAEQAARSSSAENKTVFANVPPPRTSKPLLNGQHPEAHIGAAPSAPTRMPAVPHMSAAQPGTALPARVVDKIVSIESVGAGFLVAKMSDGTTQKRNGPMNWRNNNPGNLRYSDWSKTHGAIGDAGGYAVFPDVETGRKARESLLFEGKTRQHYDQLTVSKMIEVYAPPSENPTAAYQKFVLAALNGHDVRLADMTTDERKALMTSMEKFEGFKSGTVSPSRAALPDNATGAATTNVVVSPVIQTNVGGGSSGGGGMMIPAAPMRTGHPDETLQAMRRSAPLD